MSEQGAAAAPPRRGRGRPAKLSREAIVAAALALVDREGSQALTMRRLGSELGVEAMSLYRHVADRDALLAALADSLGAQIAPAAPSEDWAEALRHLGGELRAIARAHPGAFALVGTRVLGSPRQLRAVEDVLASLRRGGFTPARAVFAYRLIVSYARGYALSEIEGFALEPPGEVRLPAVRSLRGRLAAEPTENAFRAGLETIIAGLRAE